MATKATNIVIIKPDDDGIFPLGGEDTADDNTYWELPEDEEDVPVVDDDVAGDETGYWDVPNEPQEDDTPNDNTYWEVLDPDQPPEETSTTTPQDNNNNYWEVSTTPNPLPDNEESMENDDDDLGILSSLRLFDNLRQDMPGEFLRGGQWDSDSDAESKVDIITLPTTNSSSGSTTTSQEIAFCHLAAVLPFTGPLQTMEPWLTAHEDAAVLALAAHHLNVGDGSIIPEVAGLHQRCSVRFTTEWMDTEFLGGTALGNTVDFMGRPPRAVERNPCAFLGAYRSAISIPMSIVTGLFGYPQISPASTSVSLDDTTQYPLFGRTLPTDEGNAIPIIRYMKEVLNLQHVAIMNVNDAYGNAYVDGMRKARDEWAPDMLIHQVPLDEADIEASARTGVASLKKTGYRFIFLLVFSNPVHDAVMNEAYKQGVAGTGVHNFLFGDSFLGTLDGRTFELNSPLHLAYRGSGLFEVSGGVTGMPRYDKLIQHVSELRNNPKDLEYIGSLFPKHTDPRYLNAEGGPPFVSDDDTFLEEITSGFAPFMYEAVVALGLAACQASEQQLNFTGQQHFDAFLNTTFTGFSGAAKFDNVTGTRDPGSALYKVTNYVENFVLDEATGEERVRFVPINTNLFLESQWEATEEYLFNDGTSNLPIDKPLPDSGGVDDSASIAVAVVIPLVVLFAMAVAVFLFYENRRKKNESVWEVEKEELTFGNPPQIIGRGSFGLVLLAEYRGTQVAVKRVIPPKDAGKGKKTGSKSGEDSYHADESQSNYGALGEMSASNLDVNMNGSMTGLSSSITGMSSGMGTMLAGSAGRTNTGTASGSSGAPSTGMSSMNNRSWVLDGISNGLHDITTGLTDVGGGIADGIDKGINGMLAITSTRDRRLNTGGKKRLQTEASRWKAMKKDFLEEMRYLSKLRHPCITTVMGAVTKGEPMLIMEYMDHGSLYDLLHNETMVIEGELLLPLLRDITQGVRFLHTSDPPVIHGDLKSGNILVDSRFRAKVADFGLSKNKQLGGTGTPFFMAPELLRHETCNTLQSDVFSFGVVLYEVFARRDPYEGENANEVLKLVADKKTRKRPPPPRHMPDPVKTLMKDCVEEEAEMRPSFEEIDTRLKRIDAESLDTGKSNRNSTVSLFDIFPRHIAEALRDGRTPEAEHRDSVTIFFSDIVGFTTISSELEPRKVANLLDRLYSKLDALSNKHDIFKVETIGDAYMAVTNLVKDQEDDHAKRIAEFAVEALVAANETRIDEEDEAKGYVNIRVGFHSGPVVADVVGTRNPRYCLFGDTVNTASRMESNSEVNRIHCSKKAAALLHKQHPDMPLKARGKIEIKGKGEMSTYWVNEASRRLTKHMSLKMMVGKLHEEIDGVQQTTGQPLAPLVEHSSEFGTGEFLMSDESNDLSKSNDLDHSKSSMNDSKRGFRDEPKSRSGRMVNGRLMSGSGRMFSSRRRIEPPEAAVREDSKPSLFDVVDV